MKSKTSPQQQSQESLSLETPKKRILPTVVTLFENNKQTEDEFQTPTKTKRRSAKKLQRRRTSSESDEDKIDKKTEENIQQAAIKNNLSEDTVKKILKKVVSNDHVLAIVKLKEDEMERNCHRDQSFEVDEEEECEQTPKITRSKAKTLNKRILPITSPMEPSEASILIHEELGSDDEDEEYEPGNEDDHSDDDPNSSISDMDSQPSTPKTPYTADEDTPTKYTNDGLFKIPRDRKDSATSQHEHDYIIAKRTRSKVSLATTSIETIESTFQPPDISPDMYDRGNEMDTDWLEFLNVLTKPINQTVEEDDETDPEYVVADQIPIDKEELREVNISKKELNDLVDELFSNLSDVDFDEINKYDIIPELFRTKQKPSRTETNNEVNKNIEQFNQHNTPFEPSQISTPISSRQHKSMHTISTTETNMEDTSIVSMLSSSMLSNQTSVANSNNQTPLVVPINVVNPLQGAPIVNGVIQIPQYQQVLIQIPTIDILKLQAQMQSSQQQSNTSISETVKTNETFHHQTPESIGLELQQRDDFIKRPTNESIYRTTRYQHHLFQHLKIELPVNVVFDDGLKGFTHHQRDILNQQLRMHVQFATQNFLQVYGHPGNNLWQHAVTFKSFLTDLNETTKDNLHIENLQPALHLVNKWEEDLSTATTENTEFLEFLLAESNKSQNAIKTRGSYIPKFTERMMNVIVDSPVFMYPHLLPKIPFRLDFTERKTLSAFVPIEDYLIAFLLEKIYKECHDEKIRNKCQSRCNMSLERVCHKICLRICPFRVSDSMQAVYKYVLRRKSKSEPYNPIQYYFEHKKAPLFKHHLININLNNKVAPKDMPLNNLLHTWAEHVKRRQAIEHNKRIQQAQTVSPKPIQKVSPRLRCKNADNQFGDSNIIHKPPAKPVFIIKPINRNDTVPIQYEIVEINSAPFTDLSETSTAGTSSCVEDNLKEESRNRCKSSEELKQVESQVTSCIDVKRRKQRRLKQKRKTSESHVKFYFSEFNPNESGEQEANVNVDQTVKDQCLTHEPIHTCSRKIVQKYLRITQQNHTKRLLLQKLCRIVQNYKCEYYRCQHDLNSKKQLLDVHNSIQTLHVYVSLLIFNLKMTASVKQTIKEYELDLKRSSKLVDDEQNNNGISDKPTDGVQLTDNTRLIQLSEIKEDINEKDMVSAKYFLDKVEETYIAENNPHNIKQLTDILRKFNESTDKVPDLYYKMEQLFLPHHPELPELFLTFLLPGQVAQVGKFMEHFMLTNMDTFSNKLNLFFNKQPTKVREIMTCLRDLSNEHDLKLEQIKAKLFPLLKGNPLLIEWFKQCFPSEYDCSADEHKSPSFHKAENPLAYNGENISRRKTLQNSIEYPCHNSGNRIILPAKLAFLIVTARDNKNKEYHMETLDNNIEQVANEEYCSDAADDAEVLQSPQACVQIDKKGSIGNADLPENLQNEKLTSNTHGIHLNRTVSKSTVVTVDDVAYKPTEVSLRNPPKKQAAISQRKKPNSKKSAKCSLSNNSNGLSTTVLSSKDSQSIQTAKRSKRFVTFDEVDEQVSVTKKPKISKCSKTSDRNRKKKLTQNEGGHSTGGHSTGGHSTGGHSTGGHSTGGHSTGGHSTGGHSTGGHSTGGHSTGGHSTGGHSTGGHSTGGNSTGGHSTGGHSTGGHSTGVEKHELSSIWSRNEDKLVLEQLKMGFANEEDLVKTLHEEKFPNRSCGEIYDRCKFLMDIIVNL